MQYNSGTIVCGNLMLEVVTDWPINVQKLAFNATILHKKENKFSFYTFCNNNP
jgi:hypothetical protein